MEYTDLIIAIIAGLATAIPLVIKLVEYVRKSVQEKNWGQLVSLVIDLMEEAETKFEDGATRKEWVMAMAKAAADSINYEIDEDSLSKMIDALCDMSKVVNAPATTTTKKRSTTKKTASTEEE
jgi:hypothetical protein|nr:MAG TPA: holin [Caudoviricetes sp.]